MLRFKTFLKEENARTLGRVQFGDMSQASKDRYNQQREIEQNRRLRQGLPRDPALDVSWEDAVQTARQNFQDYAMGIEQNPSVVNPAPKGEVVSSGPLNSVIEYGKNALNQMVYKTGEKLQQAQDTGKAFWAGSASGGVDVGRPANIEAKIEREAGVRYRPSPDFNPNRDDYYERYKKEHPNLFGKVPFGKDDYVWKTPPTVDIRGFSRLFSPEEMQRGVHLSSGRKTPESPEGIRFWEHPYQDSFYPKLGMIPNQKFNPQGLETEPATKLNQTVVNPIEAYVNPEDIEKFVETKKKYQSDFSDYPAQGTR